VKQIFGKGLDTTPNPTRTDTPSTRTCALFQAKTFGAMLNKSFQLETVRTYGGDRKGNIIRANEIVSQRDEDLTSDTSCAYETQ